MQEARNKGSFHSTIKAPEQSSEALLRYTTTFIAARFTISR